MTRPIGPALRRLLGSLTLPEELPGWQRLLVGIGAALLTLVGVVTSVPEGAPAWVYALTGWLGVLALAALASVLIRRLHPALRRTHDDTG
ncbi:MULTISPECIES: hypothetical protein [Pseudonocardia]|uniref:hypothetical protein n=1 Tax=Pseudonocardia TaxID=1847 RepID=UPI000A27FDBD|nr:MULTISPECIES: hypothetical protein [Pseudonocardia]